MEQPMLVRLFDLETREVTEHPTTTEARRAYHARYGRQPGRWCKTEIPGATRPVYEKADDGELYAVTWRVEDDERVRGAFGLLANT